MVVFADLARMGLCLLDGGAHIPNMRQELNLIWDYLLPEL